ncbi:MAG: SDR family NAD(P)-dependent oxidoreductase [Pseudomonadales bacterium]|nr:SDR family NAD(P)-dependent oxidoreductase [Pseudomonadales bacterium]
MTTKTPVEIFSNGVAVITGAGSGIGEALVRHAALQLGMRVVLADIDADRIEVLAADLKAQGCNVLPVVTDVSDYTALQALANITAETYGNVRLLVNNAGIESLGLIWDIPPQQWDRTIAVNIGGVAQGVRAFAPAMIDSNEHCVIANLSSIGGLSMSPFQAAYIMSKHAVLSLTECLHLEMSAMQTKVQVSAVLPGPVRTRIFEDTDVPLKPVVYEHRELMRKLLDENGMTAEDAAGTIFEQLASGQFWVSTHPKLTQITAQQRARHLAGMLTPALPEDSAFNTD